MTPGPIGAARRPARVETLSLPSVLGRDLPHALIWLTGTTILAAVLRLYRLTSDLWLDEITTILDYRNVSAWRVVTEYTSSNNHLANTLFVKAMLGLFGPAEWAVRLPALLFGVACIPAVYALARVALARREAFLAALFLSVSYHHVFFSQNARGYTALLFWAMLGTRSFLRAVSRGGWRDWILYALFMFLAAATVLYGFFVIAGHALALAAAVFWLRRTGGVPWRLLRQGLVACGALGLACLVLYANVLTQVNTYTETVYRTAAVGYAPFSEEFFREIARGLSAGFSAPATVAAAVTLVFAGLGFFLLLKRNLFYDAALVSPLIATAGFLLARHLRFSPRFFLWALPVACIFAAAAVSALEGRLASRARPASFVAVAILVLPSLLSLPAYYRVPKQPNRTSLDWVLAHRREGDPIAAAYLARWGLRFYGPSRGLVEGKTFFSLRTVGELEKVERDFAGRTIWLLATFPRALALEYPDLDRYIREHYRERAQFPATIGDGEISVFSRPIDR